MIMRRVGLKRKMSKLTAQEIIATLGLMPHPEGGFYREPYRSNELIKRSALPSRYSGDRCYSTLAYFFLPRGAKSHLHRLNSDEIWHFYLGDPMTLVQIDPNGKVKETILGHDLKAGQKLFEWIPSGSWMGGFPNAKSEYSLIGATVAPGFEFADLEMADRKNLVAMFPHAKSLICNLTRQE